MATSNLYLGDCSDVLPDIPDDSVDLIVTDPPYNGVKDDAWDNQWESAADYLGWLDGILQELSRILTFNGGLYLFASPQMAARVEVLVGERFHVLNSITWQKHDGTENKGGLWSRASKESMRSYFPQTERIIFAEHYNSDNAAKGEAGYAVKCDELRGFVFEPLRQYLRSEWLRAGLSFDEANEACGTVSMAGRHYFSKSQWCLPTQEHYKSLRDYANNHNHGDEYLRREYEDLRREYEDLRRTFIVTKDVPYTDVWDQFPTVPTYPGKHPCEKPIPLLQHMILTSSRKGDMILDPFMGSGTTGIAAMQLERGFIGIELLPRWYRVAKKRLSVIGPIEYEKRDERKGVTDTKIYDLPLFLDTGIEETKEG